MTNDVPWRNAEKSAKFRIRDEVSVRNSLINKKHLKNVGPIRYCEPPLHCQSPGVASRTPAIAIAQAACDVHDDDNNNNNNDNA